jgi:hypothetical protein
MSTIDTGLWNTRFSRNDGAVFKAGYHLNIYLGLKERTQTQSAGSGRTSNSTAGQITDHGRCELPAVPKNNRTINKFTHPCSMT